MATCAECVHAEVCREYVEGLAAARGVRLCGKELESILECDDCERHKDRSRFVELPCRTGITAYAFFSGTIIEGVVIGFEITASRIVLTTVCYNDGDTFTGRFGENVFLTKEAVQALKEREG